jgi:hypothetical protein
MMKPELISAILVRLDLTAAAIWWLQNLGYKAVGT